MAKKPVLRGEVGVRVLRNVVGRRVVVRYVLLRAMAVHTSELVAA